MKTYTWLASILIVCILSVGAPCFADDTCVFMSTSDDLPPLIVILFDNGVEMQKIECHSSYDPNTNYTPGVAEELDPAKGNATLGTLKLSSVTGAFKDDELLTGGSGGKATVNGTLSGTLLSYDAQTVEFAVGEIVTGQTSFATGTIDYIAEGNGFFHENGYGYDSDTGAILPIKDDLTLDTSYAGFKPKITVDKGALWGTFPLPGTPDKTLDFPIVAKDGEWDVAGIQGVVGVTDAAGDFRYSKNYLNWLFFGSYAAVSDVDDGTDLPDKSRFYYAKLAFFKAVYATQNNAKFAIRAFSGLPGAEASGPVQPLKSALDSDPSSPTGYKVTVEFKNNVNNPALKTVHYSPLAEGLADCAEYFNNAKIAAEINESPVNEYCEQLFVIVLTPGIPSSETKAGIEAEFTGVDSLLALSTDFSGLADYDGDKNDSDDAVKKSITVTKKDDSKEVTYEIPVNYAGTTYLDDVAHLIHTHDVVDDAPPASIPGVQRVTTYTVGIMESDATKAFLRNVANNGNGNPGLYDEDDPEYGGGHFSAESPDELADALKAAINAIVERTSSFTAPVVPVTRTMSGDRIYLAFFKPNQDNFWEGNITKFGLSEYGQVQDAEGNPATYANGAMIQDAEPYWATKKWADIDAFYDNRHVYTYLGAATILTDASNEFMPVNLSGALLGNAAYTASDVEKIVYYVRGKDVYDKDGNGVTAENREIVCGDALHSEPLVLRYDDTKTVIYFGANDGMLHAVDDDTGGEMWGFIPPDQLHRLRLLVEGAGHQYFVDASPKAYIDGDKIILICGERKGGNSYFALDVSDPDNPEFLWRVSGGDPAEAVGIPAPDNVIGELGETWSEPVFGRVKSTSYGFGGEFDVFFVGGGYSADNSKGDTVLAIDVLTGETVRQFRELAGGSEVTACPDMIDCIPSSVTVVHGDADNLVDKIYVGDVGGKLWRFGRFTDAVGADLEFPDCDEDIDNWDGEALFQTGCGEINCGTSPNKDEDGDGVFNERRPFYYPPTVCLENGFDLVFAGTGDREAPCLPGTYDGFYCIKDTHAQPWTKFDEDYLAMIEVDNSLPTPATPDLKGSDKGWYVNLAPGEKVLSESTVFGKVAYFTTFTPNDAKCVPGGDARMYALNYLTGHTVFDYGVIGGGIPSKPVIVITEKVQKIIVSTGSTVADPESPDTGAGPVTLDPASSGRNFFYKWWREVFN